MSYQPRTIGEAYESLESNLRGRIEKLTNFTRRSFNFVFTRAFAREVRQVELRNLASEMSGFIDYVGGPVTEDDLQELGVENVDPDEVNQYMSDDFLDEYVKIVGIRRFEGARAAGTVTINTQSNFTSIPEGTVVSTEVDTEGETVSFETTEDVETADGVTVVRDVDIQAVEVGEQGNVPAGTIVRFESPPVGVKGVTNPDPTTGGEERESNDELRARAKSAVQTASEGGTTEGIRGYLQKNIEGVGEGDVIIDEFTEQQPPLVDVVVDGGLDSNVKDAIDFSRPTGIRHELVRPEVVQLGFDVNVRGTGINKAAIEREMEDYLLNLGISDSFYEDELIRTIMNADNDILNIDTIGGYVERVTNEQFVYDDTQTDYELDYTYDDSAGNITVIDETGSSYTEGVDFTVEDQTGDGFKETIVWDTTNTVPLDGEKFNVDYDVTLNKDTDTNSFTYDDTKTDYTLDYSYDSSGSIEVEDDSGDTYEEGVDFSVNDQNSDTYAETLVWDTTKSTPDDEETFEVTYSMSANNQTDPNNFYQTNLVRDEKFFWTVNYTETEDYEDTQDIYPLEYVPFPSTIDTISDADGNTFNKGTDYALIDDTGNGYKQSIDWSIGGSSPADNVVFTAEYDRKVYQTEEDIIESFEDTILDEDGDVYDEGVEYEITSYQKQSNVTDAIEWNSKPSTISDGDEFYLTYISDGDISFSTREKATVGTIDITQV